MIKLWGRELSEELLEFEMTMISETIEVSWWPMIIPTRQAVTKFTNKNIQILW